MADDDLRRQLVRGTTSLLKVMTGHGPDHVRVLVNDGMLTIVAERTLTRAEHAMIDAHELSAASKYRDTLQDLMCPKLAALVEETSGRSVVAALCDHALEPDVGVFNFILDGWRGNE